MVGYDTSDDAAVYQISSDLAIIQTVDIFPPVVDDPYQYGQIAAANALSDIYAMGGAPKLALNIFCFPEDFPKEAIRAILEGGHEKAVEAGAVIAGGHTIKDPVPKYGMSVTGFVHPDHILRNNTIRQGDVLILTKPLGTGILTTADKAGLLSPPQKKGLITSMSALNRYGAQAVASSKTAHACTDITGFGFLGHTFEMVQGSGLSIHIHAEAVPELDGARAFASMGFVPANAYKNRGYIEEFVTIKNSVPEDLQDLLFDPQTSGGLLFSLPQKDGESVLKEIQEVCPGARIVGWVDAYDEYPIWVE